jgi:hypothetical protein
VLLPLSEQNGLRMGELARRASLSKQTMTELIRRLERDGLVERHPAQRRPGVVDLPDGAQPPIAPVAAAVQRHGTVHRHS